MTRSDHENRDTRDPVPLTDREQEELRHAWADFGSPDELASGWIPRLLATVAARDAEIARKNALIVEALATFMREVPKPVLDALAAWRELPDAARGTVQLTCIARGEDEPAFDVALALLRAAAVIS